MSDLRKAAEMALEALEDIFGKEKVDVGAIQALRQALAEEDADEKALWGERQEPFAWFIQYSDSHEFSWDEPSGCQVHKALTIEPLYTATPQKEWVGLTDREIEHELTQEFAHWWNRHVSVCRAIETKLKDKNT